MKPVDHDRHPPSTLRNRGPIFAVLRRILPPVGLLLEVASGTGGQAAFMAPQLGPELFWQPSEARPEALIGIDASSQESGCRRIHPAILLDVTQNRWPLDRADAVFCCNMIHIAPWAATEGLVAGAARLLRSDAPLILYGPYRRHGVHTAPSNEAFDASLCGRDPRWGVRCLDTQVTPLAGRLAFRLDEVVEMPANNLMVVFRKRAAGSGAQAVSGPS
ncbi:MAG: DUF938 domain-containing protein [Alphaproteobacteria bacterium]|nr:DUF938 domain-containing protein [Alphaproteobacteria bacterium]